MLACAFTPGVWQLRGRGPQLVAFGRRGPAFPPKVRISNKETPMSDHLSVPRLAFATALLFALLALGVINHQHAGVWPVLYSIEPAPVPCLA